jgi:hypothetical protein
MNPYRKIIQGFMLTKGTFGKLKGGVSVCIVNRLINRVLVLTGIRVINYSKAAVFSVTDGSNVRGVAGYTYISCPSHKFF